jgi:hypothetical protein
MKIDYVCVCVIWNENKNQAEKLVVACFEIGFDSLTEFIINSVKTRKWNNWKQQWNNIDSYFMSNTHFINKPAYCTLFFSIISNLYGFYSIFAGTVLYSNNQF